MKTLNMHNYIKLINNSLLLTFTLIVAMISSLSCVDGASDKQVITINPFGVGIIVFNSIPVQFFGNGTDIDSIKVNTGLIPDGSTITARITNSSLPDELSGCVVSGSATVVGGMATFNFLAPIFIGLQGEIQAVNLAVTIETPDGTEINDFVTLTILAVGITPPEGLTVESASMNDLDSGFLNVDFTTFGFDPGTMATCSVSNPALGSLASTMVPVSGTKALGALLVQYLPAVGTPSGTQTVLCSIIIQNPISVNPSSCSNVSVSDRTASAEAVIDQGASSDITNPPAPESMTCSPNPVTGGTGGTCTCTNNEAAAGQTINFTGSANLMFIAGSAIADVNGTAVLAFTTNVVAQTLMEQVTCGPAASMNVAQTTVTINPPGVNSLDCVPNPITSDDMDSSLICTCSTDSPLTQVCLDEFLDPDMAIMGLPTCITSDANGNAIFTPTVEDNIMEATSATLECCVDTDADGDMDDDCEMELVAQDTITINPFVPPVISIDCSAQDDNIGPGDDTFIDISTVNVTTDVCVSIIIQTEGISDGKSEVSQPITDTFGDPDTQCSIVDANGNASIQFRGGDVDVADDATVRCFVDSIDTGSNAFDPGEISTIEVITVDPNAAPTPVQVGCSPFPVSVSPGQNSLLTATIMNAAPGIPVCFEFFSNTTPASDLSDSNEPAPDTLVCSTTNLANQAFATFESDSGITSQQNANIICCADLNASMDDCDPSDPQTITAVQVNPVPPVAFQINITADADNMPGPGVQRFVDVAINPPVPAGTTVCLFMTANTISDTAANQATEISDADETETALNMEICSTTPDATGIMDDVFDFFPDDDALSTEFATVVACIDLDASTTCDMGEPLSNSLSFIIP